MEQSRVDLSTSPPTLAMAPRYNAVHHLLERNLRAAREDADQLTKPCAYVLPADGHAPSDALAEEPKGSVKARLAPGIYPRWREFVRALPKTATGKIQRFGVRAGSAGAGVRR